ncbi:MAG: putative amidohydrolase [Pirellulaceae bacterium]
MAKEHHADVAMFPELSLTGYEPTLASESAIDSNDDVLRPLIELAVRSGVTIVAGCPIRSAQSKPFIGAFIVRPDMQTETYRKRFLHPGEEEHFIPSNDTFVCSCSGRAVGIAICADINNPMHPADASKHNATVYAAGVAMTLRGIDEAEANLSNYAKQYRMLAVMANYASATGGHPMAGRSEIWNESGVIVAQAAGEGECIVLAENGGGWIGRVVEA